MPLGFGWQPDLPDGRDHTYRDRSIRESLGRLQGSPDLPLPDQVDLRGDSEGEYFTEVDDQGPLNASTAFAVLALVEYFQRRVHARTFDASRLFLYQATCHRGSIPGRPLTDSGAPIRGTLKTLMRTGVPTESYWPYQVENFATEPSVFVCAGAQRPVNLCYFRLDEPNTNGARTWATVKSFLAAGFPVVFGFSVPASLTREANIPYRPELDGTRGGQTVVAVGYRSDHYGPDQDALLIRSSWGRQWGDNGNGWLPVAFLRNQLARDFWTLFSDDWIRTGELTRPVLGDTFASGSRL
ncbi:Papain family cysteine protease [Stieleria maiorica]|uniref:Papain family cysteine protease n=2 Tax=Stieleria maiorica TaxID=2795974 RepID=A0A5B9MGN8_9BACT|nr:Papain family cysteine protease [Stieleria maiorica]